MVNYNLLYLDRSWLLFSIWDMALRRLTKIIRGIYSGILERVNHFNKTGDFIVPAKSLRKTPTDSFISGIGTFSGTITVDSGADLLVVCLAAIKYASSGTPTAVTCDGQTMTRLDFREITPANEAYTSAIYWLRNPNIGTKTLTITAPTQSYMSVLASCFIGSKSTPFRTPTNNATTATSSSISATSAIGDIVIDNIVLPEWTPGADQIRLDTNYYAVNRRTSIKNGLAGSTPMSWSGASSTLVHVAGAIAGS